MIHFISLLFSYLTACFLFGGVSLELDQTEWLNISTYFKIFTGWIVNWLILVILAKFLQWMAE
jgi:hypothetical protein